MAHISTLYKKGAVDMCENYHPISLLGSGYKVFAALVRQRLIDAGAEERLSKTQFGFRSGCGTADAIFFLRRKIEMATSLNNGKLMVLALDWARAFDSISPPAMIEALRRFGITEHVLRVIQAIYSERSSKVVDCNETSKQHAQNAGISQGCPLSPFLFVMIMTILMHDAAESLDSSDQRLLERGGLTQLLYADDTLLLGVSSSSPRSSQ